MTTPLNKFSRDTPFMGTMNACVLPASYMLDERVKYLD